LAADGVSPWRINLHTAALLMLGFAQHVPLVGASAEGEDSPQWTRVCARAGWFFWRVSGPMLFAGCVFGVFSLVGIAAASLFACFGCVAAVSVGSSDVYGEPEARVLNAVFGGFAAVFGFAVVFGVIFGLMVAAGSLNHSGRSLMLAATFAFAAICAIGWTPSVWRPSNLAQRS